MMIRPVAASLVLVALCLAQLPTSAQTRPPASQPTPAGPAIAPPTVAPAPIPLGQTSPAPPGAPAAGSTSTMAPATVPSPPAGAPAASFTGQLLDVRDGYAYFSTGDAFHVADGVRVVDYATGAPTGVPAQTKMYAKATFDQATGKIVQLAITKKPLPYGADYAELRHFAVAYSTPVPAPELDPKRTGSRPVTGKPVPVTIYVEVPPSTPLTDSVFIATDISGWVPNAIRMDRVDALHYRLTRVFASGTKFAYRFTRGSWTQAERGDNGLEPPPHQLTVNEVDAERRNDVVYYWSDQNAAQPQVGPNSIPTPFSANPFVGAGLPSRIPQPRPVVTPVPPGR